MQKLLTLFILITAVISAKANGRSVDSIITYARGGPNNMVKVRMPDGQVIRLMERFRRVYYVNGTKVEENQLEQVAGALLRDPATKYGQGQPWEFVLGPGQEDVLYVIWFGTPPPASPAGVRNQAYIKRLFRGRTITGVIVAYQYSPVSSQMTGYIMEWEDEKFSLLVSGAGGRMPQLAHQLLPGDIVSITVESGGFYGGTDLPSISPWRMVKEGELLVDKTYIQI